MMNHPSSKKMCFSKLLVVQIDMSQEVFFSQSHSNIMATWKSIILASCEQHSESPLCNATNYNC